jgi:hypothetical protein
MNHRYRYQRYKELELISDKPMPALSFHPPTQPARSWLRKLWDAFDAALLRDLEGRIWHSTDAQTGQVRWHLYNPNTGKTHHLNSEAEVRQWLKQVFDHSPG